MDYNNKQELTMDFPDDSRSDDKTTAVLTQLAELTNLIANHLGSGIDPKDKTVSAKKKSGTKVDVVRMAATPFQGKVMKANNRVATRDFTGSSISKEETDDEEEYEKLLPQLMGSALAIAGSNDDEKKADMMSTSEGKALLTSLQEAANKLRSYLTTTRVSSSQALTPNDMRPSMVDNK